MIFSFEGIFCSYYLLNVNFFIKSVFVLFYVSLMIFICNIICFGRFLKLRNNLKYYYVW